MVMELMDTSLAKFVENNKLKITFENKMSILHDVSLGLSFLHNHQPQILHRDLSPNNVLLTTKLVAKIGDLGVAKVVQADSRQTRSKLTTAPGTLHFMPPEALEEINPIYGTPIDVFSFGGIALHVFSEEWPTPSGQKTRDPVTKKLVARTEVERRQQYLEKMIDKAAEFRKMVERCLDDDPDERPPIQEVSTIIETLKESPSLVEGLQSEQYRIKWTTCSDLPCKLYSASVAVSADGSTVYVTGDSSDENNHNNVYCYDMKTDCWTVLPQPGHCLGILHTFDDKLTIFGGCMCDSAHKSINKVTTYNSNTSNWYSHYPDMLSKRYRPGVITYNNYVIVMGGKRDPGELLDSIEIMNYHNDLQWKEVSFHLPLPMWHVKSTISDNNITIIGFVISRGKTKNYYKIPIGQIILSLTQPHSAKDTSAQWKQLTAATYFNTTIIPRSHPPVVIGGSDINSVATSDIMLYDTAKDMWRKVDTLTSARRNIGVGLLNNKSIIIIGGNTRGGSIELAEESAVTKVEIGNISRDTA